jgi:TolB protein
MNKRRFLILALGVAALACNLFAAPDTTQSDNLLATLQASTPLGMYPVLASPEASPTPAFIFPTVVASAIGTASVNSIPAPSSSDGLTGKIVFTCQMSYAQSTEQVCMMNADGSGWKRLTTENGRQRFYPSLSPDGGYVLYSAFREKNVFEIYELTLSDGTVKQLTNKGGVLDAPEMSPDGKYIVYARWTTNTQTHRVMLMERNGNNPDNVTKIAGWNPTWSPDGKRILFASDTDGAIQLYVVNSNGKELHRIVSLPALVGPSDWSPDGKYIVTHSGDPWKHEIYLMNADGSNAHVVSPLGGNAQEASFSPDGQWIVFTAYFDHPNDENGCEIYVMRIDGTDLRRLTNNDYCDYQPRWGT